MKVSLDYGPRTEALRLLHSAHQIAAGFYKINGLVPLPSMQLTAVPKLPPTIMLFHTVGEFTFESERLDNSSF